MRTNEFQYRRRGAQVLVEQKGFAQLLTPDPHQGGIKRDTWEENFGTMVREMRLSRFVQPTQPEPKRADDAGSPANDARTTVSLGDLQSADPQQAANVKSLLAFWLGQSPDLK